MSIYIHQIIISIVTSGLFSTILKIFLDNKSAKSLEKLKSSLALEAANTQALKTRLIERRFNAIAKVHNSLMRFYDTVAQFVQPIQIGDCFNENRQAVYKAYRDFEKSRYDSYIFLPEHTVEKLEDIRQKLISNSNIFVLLNKPDYPNRFDEWKKILKNIEGPLKKSMTDLESNLRNLLDG